MQPHIMVTAAPEDTPSSSSFSHKTSASGSSSKASNGYPGKMGHLNVPSWETARRPSCLPNDTEMNLRPKMRKLSTYNVSINDTINTDSGESNTNVVAEDLVDNDLPPCLEYITQWVLGDVQYITDFLDRWPLFSFVLPLRMVNALLRTLGAPILANNPFSGALVLLALLLEAPLVALWGFGALLVALVMALILKQPQHIISSGQVTQHGLLLGLLVGHSTQQHHDHTLPSAVVALALTAALSVVLGIAVSTWFSQTNLPGLTVSFMVLGATLTCGLGYHDFSSIDLTSTTTLTNATTFTNIDLQWSRSSMPVLTTPHVVATLVLLHARVRGGQLKRVDLIYLTFPEMHRRLFRPGNAIEDCAVA